MRFQSWERLDVNYRRASILAGATGLCVCAAVIEAASRLIGLPLSVVLGGISGCASTYVVALVPRRVLQRSAFQQALEAPSLAAAANIYLRSTRSRAKTFLALRAEEPLLSKSFEGIRRSILLGHEPSEGLTESAHGVISDSVALILQSVARVDSARVDERGEEIEGLLSSSELAAETRFPIVIAVAFFMPIMLILVASVTHNTSLVSLLALVVLEIIVMDLTLTLSGGADGWAMERRSLEG